MNYDITFHPSWWHKNAGIDFTEDFFQNPKYRIESDVKMRKCLYEYFGKYGLGEKNPEQRPILGSDLLAAGYLHSALAGCEIVFYTDNSPQVKCKQITDEEIDGYHIGDYKADSLYKNMQEQVDFLKCKFGYVIPCINLMGIQNIALDLMGQNLFIAYYTEPEAIDSLLNEITDMSIDIGKYFRMLSPSVSAGVTSIIKKDMPNCYLTSNCTVEMISNELYEDFLLKYDNRLAEEFGCFGIHHCGQTMEHVVSGYSKVKGLSFAEVGAGSNVKSVREALPGVFLNMRYSPVDLMNDSKSEMENKLKRLVSFGEKDISISCVGIDKNINDEQINLFLETIVHL